MDYQSLLVGGIPTPLKNRIFVSWDYEIPKVWKHIRNAPKHQTDWDSWDCEAANLQILFFAMLCWLTKGVKLADQNGDLI